MKFLALVLCVAVIGGSQAFIAGSLDPLFDQVKSALSETLKNAVNSLKDVAKQSLQALLLNIGSAVQSKRDLSNFLEAIPAVGSKVHDALHKTHSLLNGVWGLLKQGFGKIMDKAGKLELTAEGAVHKIDQLVGSHNKFLDGILGHIKDAVFSNKRSIADFGNTIKGFFSSQIDSLKELATNAGTVFKAAASNLVSAGQASFKDLLTKLQPHGQALKDIGNQILQHGQKALDAMKDATTDILQQTVNNMLGSVQTAKETLTSAGNTIVQHVAQTLGGH